MPASSGGRQRPTKRQVRGDVESLPVQNRAMRWPTNPWQIALPSLVALALVLALLVILVMTVLRGVAV